MANELKTTGGLINFIIRRDVLSVLLASADTIRINCQENTVNSLCLTENNYLCLL